MLMKGLARRAEEARTLQLLLLKPKLAILDEIDSGLDSDGVKILIKIVTQMKQGGTAFMIITHSKNWPKK